MNPLVLPGIVVPIPDAALTPRRDLVYSVREGRDLTADIVQPLESRGTILLIHGEPVLEEGGCFWGMDRAVKDSGPIQTWLQLLLSQGFAVVAFNRRSSCGFTHPGVVDDDIDSLLSYLEAQEVDCERLGVLAFSGGTPFALSLARRDRRVGAVVTMYGPLDLGDPALGQWFPGMSHPSSQGWDPCLALSAPAPHLHVWPMNDWLPNGAEGYARHSLARGFPFTLERHPFGGHGFDFLNDDDHTHAIVARIVQFLRAGLSVPKQVQSSLFGEESL